jgi:non-heme chloroperoxidase
MVTSVDGTRLAVYMAGRADAPLVLLVHGWAQSAACWHHQFDDPALTGELRLAAVDLRGHGSSDAPTDSYDKSLTWADDLRVVLDALGGGPAVLVGWSYGALVVADHIGHNGTAGVAGLLISGGLTGIGRGVAAGRIGPVMRAALPDALSPDRGVSMPALATFVDGWSARPLPDAKALLDVALVTPAHVRAALFDRTEDGTRFVDAVRAAPVPVLVQHGTDDAVVSPSTAQHHLASVHGATADLWAGGGHALFLEDAPRFADTLLAFAERANRAADRPERTTT